MFLIHTIIIVSLPSSDWNFHLHTKSAKPPPDIKNKKKKKTLKLLFQNIFNAD